MRILGSLVTTIVLLSIACGDEASAVRGTWTVSRLTIGFAENVECGDLDEQQTTEAGTMTFDDVPHPDGLGDHTLTYSLTKMRDAESGELVDADPPLSGTAGWQPDDGKEETAGFTVTDPVNASMAGLWNILESAFGAVNVEHLVPEELEDGTARCTRAEYFLVAP
jgi:hypothetical protein